MSGRLNQAPLSRSKSLFFILGLQRTLCFITLKNCRQKQHKVYTKLALIFFLSPKISSSDFKIRLGYGKKTKRGKN